MSGFPGAWLMSGGRRSHVQEGRAKRLLWILIIVLIVVLCAQLIYHLVLSPNLRVKSVSVRSELDLTTDEVVRIAGIEGPEYYFSVDLDMISKRLESYPPVRSAVVEKSFPAGLSIQIYARKPLALALVESDSRSVPVAFDEEGTSWPKT